MRREFLSKLFAKNWSVRFSVCWSFTQACQLLTQAEYIVTKYLPTSINAAPTELCKSFFAPLSLILRIRIRLTCRSTFQFYSTMNESPYTEVKCWLLGRAAAEYDWCCQYRICVSIADTDRFRMQFLCCWDRPIPNTTRVAKTKVECWLLWLTNSE